MPMLATLERHPKGTGWIVRWDGNLEASFLSRYDAEARVALLNKATDWLAAHPFPSGPLTEAQRNVIIGAIVSEKRTPCAAGHYAGNPAIAFPRPKGQGQRIIALNAQGYDQIHINNRDHVTFTWQE